MYFRRYGSTYRRRRREGLSQPSRCTQAIHARAVLRFGTAHVSGNRICVSFCKWRGYEPTYKLYSRGRISTRFTESVWTASRTKSSFPASVRLLRKKPNEWHSDDRFIPNKNIHYHIEGFSPATDGEWNYECNNDKNIPESLIKKLCTLVGAEVEADLASYLH